MDIRIVAPRRIRVAARRFRHETGSHFNAVLDISCPGNSGTAELSPPGGARFGEA